MQLAVTAYVLILSLFVFFLAQAFQETDGEKRNKNTLVLSLMFLLLGVITLATYIIQVSVTVLKCWRFLTLQQTAGITHISALREAKYQAELMKTCTSARAVPECMICLDVLT